VQTAWIVSSGRTGTQFLAHYLAGNFDDVVAVHEPKPRISARLVSNAWAAGAAPRALPRALLRRKAARIASLTSRLYVESNPFLWGVVDLIDEVFAGAKIIHVVRDPREQVRSSLNHGTAAGLKGAANRWLPFWYPNVGSLAAVGRAPDWLERAAGLWALVNERLRRVGTGCRDYHLLRYEDLFDEEYSGLRALGEHLGLGAPRVDAPVDPGVRLNAGARDALPAWESWNDAQCGALHRICGPLMREYGYGEEPAWQRRVGAGRETATR